MSVLRSHFSRAELFAVGAELSTLLVIFWIGSLVDSTISAEISVHASVPMKAASSAASSLLVVLSLYFHGLYDFRELQAARGLWVRFFSALMIAGTLLWVLNQLITLPCFGPRSLAISVGLATTVLLPWRHLTTAVSWRRVFADRILIVGVDEAAVRLGRAIEARGNEGHSVVGFFGEYVDRDPSLGSLQIVDGEMPLLEAARSRSATKIVVAQQDTRGRLSLDSLLDCKLAGFKVERASEFFERFTGRILLDDVRIKSSLVFSDGFVVPRFVLWAKRLGEIAVSSMGLALASPLMFMIAVLVRVDSPGPALYCQERLGRNGRPFVLWKFRSMRQDAEADGAARWATQNDDRVTRLGRILRRSRLDELPQLWNVLRGDMSMVGPRPEREEFVRTLSELNPIYQYRLSVRPGLTGWAQVKSSYAGTLEESLEKLSYDLFYIKNVSLRLDASILASTVRLVLFGRGSR